MANESLRTTIRVFVVDDHPMIRHGLAAMVQAERELHWVGDASTGEDAVRLAPALKPDVVLMDLVMPQMDGIAAISALRPLLPGTRFIVLTSLLEPSEVKRALDAGASSFLLKNASAQELITVIRATASGHRVLAPEVTDALIAGERRNSPGTDLTQRERELLALMARGLSNQEISNRLAIAMPTVKFHVTNILAKLHADNRTEAVLTALKHKLVMLD
jgi:NarL family two-component system response regulator LiaR